MLNRFNPSVVISKRDKIGNVGDTFVLYRLESVVADGTVTFFWSLKMLQ